MSEPTAETLPVSVVICSRERPRLLEDTVRSVLDGERVPAEIVIVDQSAAAHAELAAMGVVRGCEVRYLHSGTVGLSRARNVGLRAARSDVAVLIDDDMYVERDWLAQLVAGRPEGERTVATGRVLPAPAEGEGGVVPAAALVERDEPAVFTGLQALDVVPGANVALPRELVLELGGYDERLGAGTRFAAADDNDMGHRLLAAGCEVHHVPSAVVLHRAWRGRDERVRLRWDYGRGKGAFFAKHSAMGDEHVRRRARAEVARRLRRAGSALPRRPKAAASELISLGGLASGALGWTMRERFGRGSGAGAAG